MPALEVLRVALLLKEPDGYPPDKPLPKSAIKLTLSNDLIPKICNVLRLLLGPVSELAARPPTDWGARTALVEAFHMAGWAIMYTMFVSQLLPVLPDRPETSRLFAQLSDESLLQRFADWSRLAETVGWGLADFQVDATAAPPDAQSRPKAYRARNTSYEAPSTFSIADNVTGSGGHNNAATLVSNASFTVKNLVEYACKSSHASAAPRLPLLAATLHRTQLLAAVSSALRSAPALPFWGSGGADGPVEAAAVAYAGSLDSLLFTTSALAKHVVSAPAAVGAVPYVLELLSGGELQRLLLEEMERVAELYEEEAGMASSEAGGPHGATALSPSSSQPSIDGGPVSGSRYGGGSGGGPAARRRSSGSPAAASTTAAGGTADGGTRGPGGGWPLFDASVAPPLWRGAALLPGMYEAWGWGLAAVARRIVRAIKGGGGSSGGSAEVKGALLSAQELLISGQQLMGASLPDPRAGWPALSPALREDVVRRLAGAGQLRSWDTALRLAAESGDARLLGSAVSALLPSVELFMVPLLREAMRPRPLSAAAATAACPVAGAGAPAAGFPPSSLLLPPPVPVTDLWDGARELGWLVTAAKLVSQHDWKHSGGRVHSGEASSSWGFLSLRGALRSVALGPAGLPALLTELAAEPAAVAEAAAAGAHAGTGPDPRVLALLEGVALAARAVFATSHLVCAESTTAVLPSTASEVTALRSATRLLPPPAVLGAEPLLPLGAAAAALRALMAKGGSGTVPNAVASAARRLAQSVVTALAELAAEPVLEPYPVGAAAAADPLAAPPALRWQPPLLDATAGMGVGEVAAAVAAFSPRSAKQLARLQAAAEEASAAPPPPAQSSPLLAVARELLQAAVDPSAAAGDPAVAALERIDRPRLAGLLPPPGCRLWPPTALRVCCNPACGDLTGDCEAGLKLRLCAGCEAARYCGAACQWQHWASGHKADCTRLKRGSWG
ncbi:hypothetical protein GPECTOR_7g947 [Gonium pectorale]|uniref:MYND-type domain-containing protein n=1 Tax=Gonium pectorale TaxID=33097 RepID=A0A150GUF2_GONPE|nr:hypothetical protein GPECTOR_7g947 [Gonium pectorale]|eukprot:KXZ53497.1 hypothetical protein GPECTOR_7g947 [Gonium pectorale]